MNSQRVISVILALAGLALFFTLRGPAGDVSGPEDSTTRLEKLAQLEKEREHARPGSAEHYKYGYKINRLKRSLAGLPTQGHPEIFAQILHDRTVPANGEFSEYDISYRVRELSQAKAAKNGQGTPVPWINRGPGNVAGRARAIVVDPDDPSNNTWYFGTAGGGVWRTTDGGASWSNLTPDFPVLSVQSLAQAASNPDIMYAGTGESYFNIDTINGNGILKTTDRGATWTHLASTLDNVDFNNVARIIVDPADPDIVVCATTTGRYKGGINPESHIFKSVDGGVSWTAVYTETDGGQFGRTKKVQQVIADPNDFNKQYATIDEKGVLISTDAGDTWTLSNSGISDFSGRFELAISPVNTDYVYMSAEGASHSELYVSTDGGLTWNETFESGQEPDWLGYQGWYDNCIVAHPFDTDIVYVGGIVMWKINLSGTTRVTNPLFQGDVHVDHHYFQVLNDGGGNWRLLNSNDGGVGVTTSGESGWYAPKDGMITTQFYGVDKAPGRDAYSGGMQDNGTWHSDDDPTALDFWTFDIGGDGYETHWHFNDPSKMMGGYQYNGLARSLNGGLSWEYIDGPYDFGSGSAPFITKIASSHESPDDVYVIGSSGVWHSPDFGGTWSLGNMNGAWPGVNSFMDVRVSRADADVVWAGVYMDDTYSMMVSTDRGANFNETNNYADVTMGQISGLATHPTDPNIAYTLFSFAQRPKILRTENLGANWTDISGFGTGSVSTNGFPDVAVYDLVVFPNDPDRIWVGTEIGLVESTDGGATWAMAENGLPNVGIWRLRVVEDEVIAATHGLGIWSVEIPELIEGSTFGPLVEAFYQPPGGELALEVILRSAADSTQIHLNGDVITTLPANPAKSRQELDLPLLENGQQALFLRSFFGGESADSITRTIEATIPVPPILTYETDFESGGADFTGLEVGGFQVRGEPGFDGAALHTPHPYTESVDLITELSQPIRVASSNATISFDEIAILEPGDGGSEYGEFNFYDYVVVEGSQDGLVWTPLGPGYDARDDDGWLTAFFQQDSGNPSLFRTRTYDLLETFEPGDQILLRFRLFSDQVITGWGWAIDNLSIQPGAVSGVEPTLPERRFNLAQNSPNPFNPSTNIAFNLERGGRASVKVFNVRGQLVRTLVDGHLEAGPNQVIWDGKDAAGAAVASGTYLYRLQSGAQVQQRKMLLLK